MATRIQAMVKGLTGYLNSRKGKLIIGIGMVNAALFGMGIYAFNNWNRLHLPISPMLPALSTLLPVINFGAFSHAISRATSWAPLTKLRTTLPAVALLLVDTIIIALSGAKLDGDAEMCSLERRWTTLFRGKDGPALESIQDSLNCCGFRTVNHMAYPFETPSMCHLETGRSEACMEPWRRSEHATAAVMLTISTALAFIKLGAIIWVHSRSEAAEAAEAASHDLGAEESRIEEVEESEAGEYGPEGEEFEGSVTHFVRRPPSSERTPLLAVSPWGCENGDAEPQRIPMEVV